MPLPPLVAPVAALPADERERTQRHAVLRGFGEESQRRLAAAHVAIVGAGGLGSPAVLALAAAGVGILTVIDDDAVDLPNLQRQVLHRLADVGAPKVDSAVRAAAELSPHTVVRAVRERLDAGNADALLSGADLVIDGSDTFATRAVVAAACERLGVPLVWGVVPHHLPAIHGISEMTEAAVRLLMGKGMLAAGEEIVVLGGNHPRQEAAAFVKFHVCGE